MTSFSFFASGMPTLFLGLMSVIFFSLTLQNAGLPYLPPNQAEAARDTVVPLFGNIVAGSFGDRLWHLVMPVGVLTLVNMAGWSRFVRSSMLEVLRQDYVRTARSKGLTERMVILKHALRNSLIPFVTLLAGVLPTLFSGAIITETIFSWPGMGKLYINALIASDYPVAMAFIIISTFLTLIGYLMTDVLYTVVDPRIRLS
jgi:peptide/nickel transport system permease protein